MEVDGRFLGAQWTSFIPQVHSRELDKESWVEILSYIGSQDRIFGFFSFLFFFLIRTG